MGVGVATGFGGVQLSKGTSYVSDGSAKVAAAFRDSADRASKLAGYYRRAEDYVFQANAATAELEGFGRQIVMSLLHEQITKHEYDQQLKRIEQHSQTAEFLAEKFTTEELYTWAHTELLSLFHDAYSFAVDVARKAEQTLKHETMRPELDSQQFVSFNHWDPGRRGLLAGERLALELKHLELAHFEQNRREYELTKHVSLARLDPLALLRLKATGACDFEIPEWVYDLDSPGQYLRRIRSVSVTLPAVVGPYSGIHAKLSLLRSRVRTSSLLGDGYAAGDEDERFRHYAGAVQSIVTSTGHSDAGLFELNLRDERRLPFEGAGVISSWRLELPGGIPQFDVSSLSDVVLTIRYTAREAGHLAAAATTALREDVLAQTGILTHLVDVASVFVAKWHAFAAADTDATRILDLRIRSEHFPYWAAGAGLGEEVVATFIVIDLDKHKLVVAPIALTLRADDAGSWALHVDEDTDALFPFLKKHRAAAVQLLLGFTVPQ